VLAQLGNITSPPDGAVADINPLLQEHPMSTTYSTKSSALILVDVLNDFLAEDGKLAGVIGPMIERHHLRPNLKRLLDGVRKVGLKTFYAPHGADEHSFDGVPYVHPRFQFGIDNRVFWIGSKGADFYEPLKPLPGDIVVGRHHMFDSFNETGLEEQLRANGIDKVILAGLTSQTCIEGTGRHALESGFHVTFLTDAVSEFSEEAHQAAIQISYPTFGHEVTTIDAFLNAIEYS
jgi:ureidoacrylate peracid hydrolase